MNRAPTEEAGDKYRTFLVGEGEKNTTWRHGGPPTYDVVNKLFEEGRTKEWPEFSLEETVQNAIKTWEMEVSHKINLRDFKTINPHKFSFSVNGRKGLSGEETLKLGSYNALLQSSVPSELQLYKADTESFESSHEVFRTAFPRGFAWEVLSVYSGPPVITFKFRHWGYMEGPFNGHAPTGSLVEFTGMAVLEVSFTYWWPNFLMRSHYLTIRRKVDEGLRAEKVEIFYDPGELLGDLLKGPLLSPESKPRPTAPEDAVAAAASELGGCPFFKGE